MYVMFSIAGADGQFEKPFSIKVHSVRWHGMSKDNRMLWDVTHDDGGDDFTKERIAVHCAPYSDFRLGESNERIVDLKIISFPTSGDILTKDQFHARVGKGMFIHPQRGHYVKESDLP